MLASIAQAEGDLPRASTSLGPLRPAADNTAALETQVYQAILDQSARDKSFLVSEKYLPRLIQQ